MRGDAGRSSLASRARPTTELLVVGDVATDVLVRVPDELAAADGAARRTLVLPLGAKIAVEAPELVTAGGNAANVAVAAARLSLRVALAAEVGGDPAGREVFSGLHAAGVDTRHVRVSPELPTNRNIVLWCRDDRTILVHHAAYPYHWPHLRPAEIPSWLYLTSLGAHALEYQDQLAEWLEGEPDVHLAFQPGTFQIKVGAAPLHRLYMRADIVLCNREEAAAIGGGRPGNIDSLLEGLHRRGARLAVVTDGAAGAYACDGDRRVYVPPFEGFGAAVERTGAGDAFAATFVAARIHDAPLDEALTLAAANAGSVVAHPGAQAGLLDEKELRGAVEDWPSGDGPVPW